MTRVLTLYRAPFSTNVERVALALAHKGLSVESVVIDYADRTSVEAVSGQPLVPVLVDGDEVISDSIRILEHLERRQPQPPLYPSRVADHAVMQVFIDWFNRVWKVAPNEIERELAGPAPDEGRIAGAAATMQEHLTVFNDLLDGRDFLFGKDFSAADCTAFPFVKFALGRDGSDDELFHQILDERQTLGEGHARLARWIRRVDALPRV